MLLLSCYHLPSATPSQSRRGLSRAAYQMCTSTSRQSREQVPLELCYLQQYHFVIAWNVRTVSLNCISVACTWPFRFAFHNPYHRTINWDCWLDSAVFAGVTLGSELAVDIFSHPDRFALGIGLLVNISKSNRIISQFSFMAVSLAPCWDSYLA